MYRKTFAGMNSEGVKQYKIIGSSPAYGVYISQLIRYASVLSSYGDFIDRGRLLTKKLVDQGYTLEHLKFYLWKFYGRYTMIYNNKSTFFFIDSSVDVRYIYQI